MVTGLGRRTREEIAKWNQMTALRLQTGGRHQTFPASFGEKKLRGSFGKMQVNGPEGYKVARKKSLAVIVAYMAIY